MTCRTKTRRFRPAVDALEGRTLLDSSLHAISGSVASGGYPNSLNVPNYVAVFELAGYGNVTPTTHVLNVSVGSPLHFFGGWLNSTFPTATQNHIPLPTPLSSYTIQIFGGGTMVSGNQNDTSYSFGTGKYKTITGFSDSGPFPLGTADPTRSESVGAQPDQSYINWMGTDLGDHGGNYYENTTAVGKAGFYVGPTVGLQDWRVTTNFGSATNHIDFMVNVTSPSATLNSVFNAGTTNHPNGEPFQFGPYLDWSNATGSQLYVRQTFTDWSVLQNSSDLPINGVTNSYRFGAVAGGLNPDQFSGLVQNTTPTGGQFYIVQVVRAPISIMDTYNVLTKQVVTNRRSVVLDASGNQLWGLDAASPQGSPQYGIPDWAWQGGSVIQVGNSPQQNLPQDGPVQVIGLNRQQINFVRDSPSISFDPNSAGRTLLVDRINHEADFQTYLVFQPTNGIPIILVTQSWSISSVESYIGPALNGMDIGAAWSAVYTNAANWQGTTTQTVGVRSNVPSILGWTFVDTSLTSTETTRVYHSDTVGPITLGMQIYSTLSWGTPPGVANQVPNPVENSPIQNVVYSTASAAQESQPVALRQPIKKVAVDLLSDTDWEDVRRIRVTDLDATSFILYNLQNKKRA